MMHNWNRQRAKNTLMDIQLDGSDLERKECCSFPLFSLRYTYLRAKKNKIRIFRAIVNVMWPFKEK
jgi:hypothetical protein